MSDQTVRQEDLAKALDALRDLAKGHSSRGTATTEVVSMVDAGAGAGSSAGATQVHHTPSNSDPGGWAGSTARDVPSDGAVDSVSSNGTDYQAQGRLMKSIIEKLAKGLPLTAEEASAYAEIAKGGMPPFMKKDDDKDDKDDKKKGKKDEEMGKSLSDFAEEEEDVAKGLEVSEFLSGFANVISKSLQAMEHRVVSRVLGAMASEAEGTGEFNKSLAEAVVRLGDALTATAQRVDQIEAQPAHAPRSTQNVTAIEKGSYGGPKDAGQPLSKALVAQTLVDLVHRGEATAQDVIKYDTSNVLDPRLEAKVRAAVAGSR